jgi:hypothetical protein
LIAGRLAGVVMSSLFNMSCINMQLTDYRDSKNASRSWWRSS